MPEDKVFLHFNKPEEPVLVSLSRIVDITACNHSHGHHQELKACIDYGNGETVCVVEPTEIIIEMLRGVPGVTIIPTPEQYRKEFEAAQAKKAKERKFDKDRTEPRAGFEAETSSPGVPDAEDG